MDTELGSVGDVLVLLHAPDKIAKLSTSTRFRIGIRL
jgi:hypothetical protein